MTHPGFRTVLLVCCWLMVAAWPATGKPDRIVIDDFENGLKPGWQVRRFAGETDYRVVAGEQGQVLQAVSRGAASGLVFEIDYAPADYPVLSWRWKIEQILARGDARHKSTDDYAARIYVIFPHWLFFKTRSLNYIWANRLPEGEFLPNSYTANAVMVAVETGAGRAGEWVAEQRDIIDDYRRAFGEDPPRVGAIAIMTDTDNTGERAVAWYDDIAISRKPVK